MFSAGYQLSFLCVVRHFLPVLGYLGVFDVPKYMFMLLDQGPRSPQAYLDAFVPIKGFGRPVVAAAGAVFRPKNKFWENPSFCLPVVAAAGAFFPAKKHVFWGLDLGPFKRD